MAGERKKVELRDYFEKLGGLWQDVFEGIDGFFEEVRQGKHQKALAVGGILLILAILAIFIFVQSQSLDLRIVDENGNPVAGARVQLFDGITGELIGETVTDENGVAHFDGVDPNRPYTYKVEKNGFEDSTGSYDPKNPGSSTLVLKKRPGLEFQNPPKLPEISVSPGPNIIRPSASPVPWNNPWPNASPGPNPVQYVVDSRLIVTTLDSETNATVANALITLKDAATATFLAQGRTNSQGTLSANVKRGSSVAIQARADGYNPSDAVIVPIDAAENSAIVRLLSENSANSAKGNVTVVDEQGQPIEGARVQVFASPSLLDQLTGLLGFIQVSLEKLRTYVVLASKTGYLEASANLSADGNVTLVLRPNPDFGEATLTVSTLNADASPAINARVTVFQQVQGQFIDVQSQSTSALGAAVFAGLSAQEYRINATAPAGQPSASRDVTLENGSNQLNITFDPTILVTPTPPPFNGTQHRACLNQPLALSNASGGTYNYTLSDLTGSQASFAITQDALTLCTNPSLACTYALAGETVENLALAEATGIRVRITAIDLQDQCVDLLAGGGPSMSSCGEQGPQVCGTNGVTYANTCTATEAGATWITEGACGLACTADYVPVCGADIRTYDNLCLARQAEAEPVTTGECPPTKVTNVPAGFSAIAPYGSGRLLATTCQAGDGNNAFYSHAADAGNWGRFAMEPGIPDLQYPQAYLVAGESACTLTFQDAGEPTYAPVLRQGYNFIAGPPTASTFNEVRGNCPAYSSLTATPTPSPTPSPSPAPTATPGDLTEARYSVIAALTGIVDFCDRDYYPVGSSTAEQQSAQEYVSAPPDADEYAVILRHLDLASTETLTDAQKLEVYREYKRLRAIGMTASGSGFEFSTHETIPYTQQGGGTYLVTGTVSGATVTINQRTASPLVCPICLAQGTRIDTPNGPVSVQELQEGDAVYTENTQGKRIEGVVLKVTRRNAQPGQKIVHIVLDDGRQAWISAGHPLPDGRTIGQISVGDKIDGATVTNVDLKPYETEATYDLLPDGFTGVYWANGIPVKSTLFETKSAKFSANNATMTNRLDFSSNNAPTLPNPDRRLYRCWHNPAPGALDHILSADPNCEGITSDGQIGLIYSTPQTGTTPLYRCRWNGGHIETGSAVCENAPGAVNEGILGHILSASTPGFVPLYRCRGLQNSDHMSSTDGQCENPPAYQNEGILGQISITGIIPTPTPTPIASVTPTPNPTPNEPAITIYAAWGVRGVDGLQRIAPEKPLEPGHGYMVYYDGSAGDTCSMGASVCPPIATPDCINGGYLNYPNGQFDANGCPIGPVCTPPTPSSSPAPTAIPEPDSMIYTCTPSEVTSDNPSSIFVAYGDIVNLCGGTAAYPFGKIYANPQPNTVPLYGCGSWLMLVNFCGYSGAANFLGYLPTQPTPGLAALYRCEFRRTYIVEEFYTFSPTCNNDYGYVVVETLGYFKQA